MEGWERYQRWNDAVARVVFPELADPVPVYMDLEQDVLKALAAEAGYDGDPREGLQEAVKGVTVSGTRFSLSRIAAEERRWRARRTYESPPAALAFLALTVLAAEDMGNSSDGFNSGNYYSRLCALLRVPPDSANVRQEYMHQAEHLWGDLNRWLEAFEGLRGFPTAYALTFRYVGLPMSQALVREGDRRKLPRFFAQYGLAAGMELAPEVLERYLDAWFGSDICTASASLRRLWARPSARERIAAVAAVELAGWDGVLGVDEESDVPTLQRLALMAHVHQGFLGSGLDIALTVRNVAAEGFDGKAEVETVGGEWLPLDLVPAVANMWRTSHSGGLDIASILEGVVKIRRLGNDSEVFRHHPRSIIPLVFDELQSTFLEAERLQLNVDSMLLVRATAKGQPLAASVVEVLRSCSRPGFRMEPELDGLPEGWVLITGVQLFGAPDSGEYNELVPLARDQLTLAGGMRIPSRIRKWSAKAPPEIRASADSASSLRLVVSNLDSDEEIAVRTAEGGALVVPLSDIDLGPGDYRAALFAGSSSSPLQQATIRLRSADNPDPGWHLAPRLVYALTKPGSPLGAISAQECADPTSVERVVDGAVASGTHLLSGRDVATTKPSWLSRHETKAADKPTIKVGSPDPASCVVTGAHYVEYPAFLPGRQQRYIEGTCKYCGLVKRSPGWATSRRDKQTRVSTSHVEVAELPPIQQVEGTIWDAAMDALMHLGGGSAASLMSIGAQIEGGQLFASAFPVRLESLGMIAVERRADGTPERWEIAPTCLVATTDGKWDLTGFWPERLIAKLQAALIPTGVRVETAIAGDGRPRRRWVDGAITDALESLLADDLTAVEHATSDILNTLPELSQVAEALPREPMPGFANAERFDVSSASWVATSDVALPGSFRLSRGFERLHIFRSDEDVNSGRAARGSVYLVKHLAANAIGESLAAYVRRSESVVVPRGCDLPGLYARALVLASGDLPREALVKTVDANRRCLVYPTIKPAEANLLTALLSQ